MEYLIPVALSSFLSWLVRFKRRAASHSSAVSYKVGASSPNMDIPEHFSNQFTSRRYHRSIL